MKITLVLPLALASASLSAAEPAYPNKPIRLIAGSLHVNVAILRDPVPAKRLTAQGLEPIGDTPRQFAQYLRDEAAKWGRLVKAADIKAE